VNSVQQDHRPDLGQRAGQARVAQPDRFGVDRGLPAHRLRRIQLPAGQRRRAGVLTAQLDPPSRFVSSLLSGRRGDRVDHAELAWPLGSGVMLGSSDTDAPGTFQAYVVCNDPDALFARGSEWCGRGRRVQRQGLRFPLPDG
jgi:hypothetical protein